MKREKFTDKLRRMAATIDAGETPMHVREFYVFGSYARGAPEPNDLDVLVVHDRLPEETVERLRTDLLSSENYQGDLRNTLYKQCQSLMRRALRKQGERIELFLAESKSEHIGPGSKIPEEELILLWTPADRDFNAKIDAIAADPKAGRAPRNHFVDIKRLHTDIGTMEEIMDMIGNALTLVVIPVERVNCDELDSEHRHWLRYWINCKVLGKDSLKLLPLAMWWLQQHGERCSVPAQTEIWSESRTHRVHIGKPSLRKMIGAFRYYSHVVRQCLIPHLKTRQENYLFVFERGNAWEESSCE